MGLEECRNTRIGSWSVKGISGGQKRRVSICIEIFLFLDEPTSGLNSAASYHVMTRIVKLAKNESIRAIATIHQPSSEVFELFHNICFLSNGTTVSFRPTLAANENVEQEYGIKRVQRKQLIFLFKAYDSSDILRQVQLRVDEICHQQVFPNGQFGGQNSTITGHEVLTTVWQMQVGRSKWIYLCIIVGMVVAYRFQFRGIIKR